MRLNRSMNATGGRTVPHVNGLAIPAFVGRVAGSPVGCWFRGRPLVQLKFGPNDWRLCVASSDGQSFEEVSKAGQNHLFAGDQVWAADLDGYRDSRGYANPNWVPVAIDDLTSRVAVAVKDTGALAVWDGFVLLPVEPTGPDLWSEDDISFIGGLLAYRKNGAIKVWPEPLTVARIPAAGVCVANGYALEYQDGRGVVLRPLGSTRGFVVSASGRDFGRDMRARPDGTLVVVSSYGDLELPAEFQRYEINPVLRTVNGEPRPLVDLTVAPVKTTSRSISVLTFDDPLDPFTLTGWDEKNQREWPVDTSTVGVLVTWPNDAPAVVESQHLRAVRLGLPVVFYADRAGLTKSVVPDYRGARRLPTPRTRITADREADRKSLAKEVRDLRKAGFDCLIDIQMTCGFRGPGDYPWPEADMYARAVDAWNVAVEEGALGVLLFNWARTYGGEVVDGISHWPLFQQFVREIKAATPDWRGFPKSTAPRPVPSPAPPQAPQSPVSLEILMAALTLKKSGFKQGSFDPSRFIYPMGDGKNLSIDGATGQPREAQANNGPSESFLYVPGSGRAEVDFGTHLYTFLVDENR